MLVSDHSLPCMVSKMHNQWSTTKRRLTTRLPMSWKWSDLMLLTLTKLQNRLFGISTPQWRLSNKTSSHQQHASLTKLTIVSAVSSSTCGLSHWRRSLASTTTTSRCISCRWHLPGWVRNKTPRKWKSYWPSMRRLPRSRLCADVWRKRSTKLSMWSLWSNSTHDFDLFIKIWKK